MVPIFRLICFLLGVENNCLHRVVVVFYFLRCCRGDTDKPRKSVLYSKEFHRRQQLFSPRTPEPINHQLSSLAPFVGHPLLTLQGQYPLKVNIVTIGY